MKTVSFAPLLAIALAYAGLPALAHPPADADAARFDIDAAARPALAVADAFSRALQQGDLKRVEALLSPQLIVLESGGAEHSRAQYLREHAPADAAFLKDTRVQLRARTARAAGTLAWVATENEMHIEKNGKPVTVIGTETLVLKREASTWRIVHIHWSSRNLER